MQMYGEIIIGPPGSGKSTYVEFKKNSIADRKPFTINLDPGNNKTTFDYDIKSLNSTKKYMSENEVGPNYSVKCILKDFLDKYDDFIDILRKSGCNYFIFDFPGQLEFFMCDDTLRNFTKKLVKEGFSLIIVNLIDLVFFLDQHSLLSTYLFSTISMILLELPHICVISKCDNLKNYNLNNAEIEDLVSISGIETENEFYDNLISIVENEGLIGFEILDYDNLDSLMYLQMIIDKVTGFLYNEEVSYEDITKEKILSDYVAK